LHLVFALVLTIAVSACSQYGRAGGGDDRRAAQDGSGQRPLDLSRMSGNDQIRLRLTDAKVALNLTSEQAGSWQHYESKVIELLAITGRGAADSNSGNSLAEIDRNVVIEQSRAAAMEQIADAARKLYAVLTDEQKRTANRVLPGIVPAGSAGPATPARGGR
jgi:hypothetical protein